MNEKIKNGIKNQIITILFMLIFTLISGFIYNIATKELTISKISCKSNGGLIGWMVKSMDVNLSIYVPCVIALLLIYSVLWSKVFQKRLFKSFKIHKGFGILYIVVYVIFIVVITLNIISIATTNFGFFNTICNTKAINSIAFAYLMIYTQVSLAISLKNNTQK